jgi:hypothetical protein
MKILKNTLIVSSYVLLVAVFFTGGYAVGKMGAAGESEPIPSQMPKNMETVSQFVSAEPEYEVIIENGTLKIYRCIGDERTVLSSEEISENVFPKDDIEELHKGVKFERLDDAQQLFENFVS